MPGTERRPRRCGPKLARCRSFEPQLVKKHQGRTESFDDRRVVKMDGTVQKRTVYIALGVNMEGCKEVLGLWMSGTEGAKFWLHVVTELKNRGVEDVLIACCDGLKGFPEAIEAVFPLAVVQTCIVHMIRNSLRLVAWGNRRTVANDLKPVYRAATVEEAMGALEAFDEVWGKSYPSITRSWLDNWERLSPFFAFPEDIRRAIYTTNAIEALNRQLRKALKPKGHFPSEEAALKVLFLALRNAATKWTMPIKRWDLALQQFAIHLEGRITLLPGHRPRAGPHTLGRLFLRHQEMAMALPNPADKITLQEYLELEQTTGVRHEWVNGVAYAMSGGTAEHSATRRISPCRSARG